MICKQRRFPARLIIEFFLFVFFMKYKNYLIFPSKNEAIFSFSLKAYSE